MREITLSDGRTVTVRPLTRREMRTGKQYGLFALHFELKKETSSQAFDFVIGTQFGEERLENLPHPDLKRIFEGIFAETYSLPGEEKNSPTSGPGARTQNGSNDAGSAADGKQ